MLENLPANSGDVGSIPDAGRSHVTAKPVRHTVEPALCSPGAAMLSPRAAAREAGALEPTPFCTREAAAVGGPHPAPRVQPPCTAAEENPSSSEDPARPKIPVLGRISIVR